MIESLISLSLRNRFLVLLVGLGLFDWGVCSVKVNKVYAIPDLSENQVIVFTKWMGRSPQIIEDDNAVIMLSPVMGAVLISVSTVVVAINATLLEL